MVGPIPESERVAFTRKLKVGTAALVALSAGLTAVQVDASLALTSGAVLTGLAVGWLLGWFVIPAGPSPLERQRQRRSAARETQFDNPFEDSTSETETERASTPRQGDSDS